MSDRTEAVMFPRMSLVRHKKTRGLYRIFMDPTYARIEATNLGAYGYCAEGQLDATLWVRPRAEMEDGRFELVTEP